MIWTPSPRPPRSQWLTNLMLRDATGFMSRPPRDARCTAEEELSDARIGEGGCRMVLDARAAEFQHDAVMGIFERALGVLFDHQHGYAALTQLTQQIEQFRHQERWLADR